MDPLGNKNPDNGKAPRTTKPRRPSRCLPGVPRIASRFVCFSLGLHRVGSVALYGALCFSSTGLHRVLGGFRVPKGPYWSYTGDSLMALFGPCMGFEFGVMVQGLGKNQQNLEEKL